VPEVTLALRQEPVALVLDAENNPIAAAAGIRRAIQSARDHGLVLNKPRLRMAAGRDAELKMVAGRRAERKQRCQRAVRRQRKHRAVIGHAAAAGGAHIYQQEKVFASSYKKKRFLAYLRRNPPPSRIVPGLLLLAINPPLQIHPPDNLSILRPRRIVLPHPHQQLRIPAARFLARISRG